MGSKKQHVIRAEAITLRKASLILKALVLSYVAKWRQIRMLSRRKKVFSPLEERKETQSHLFKQLILQGVGVGGLGA